MIRGPSTVLVSFALACCIVGCGDSPPQTPAEGEYGRITAQASTNIPVALQARPPFSSEVARTSVLACVQSELSPATLFRTESKSISFFTDLERGAPAHAAFPTRAGPRSFKSGEELEAAHMEENWVLVWFAGAPGWTNWDVPCLVFLQHKPTSMGLDTNGLHFHCDGPVGDTVLLPLYGAYKPPLDRSDSPALFAGKKVKTADWANVLTRELLMRIRYWASALREFPVACSETFSVDRSTDTITIRQSMQWHSIADDWGTKHLKLNPVSPPLGLAAKDRGFPVKFSRPIMDLEMPTPFGPYTAAEGDGPLDATFSILHEINDAAANPGSGTNLARLPKEHGTWAQWTARDAQTRVDSREYIAIARQAYRNADIDGYHFACYLFARALTQERFAHAAPEYFRKYAISIPAPLSRAQGSLAATVTGAPVRPRLIPSAPPSPLVPGIQRSLDRAAIDLLQRIESDGGAWPAITLPTESGRFSIGRVKAGATSATVRRLVDEYGPNGVAMFFHPQ